MAKKILALIFTTIILLSISVIPATAAPYNGGATISGDTVVFAVNFDTDDYNESTPQRAADGNWTWYFDARDSGGNYAHRTEYQENENGPQTEAADIEELGGDVGAICYTHDDEWVQYTLTVEVAGKYDLKVWAGTDVANKAIDISVDGKLIGSPEVIKRGWGKYDLHDVGPVELAKGTSVLKLEWPGGDVNVAAFVFTLVEAAPTEAPTEAEVPTGDGAAAETTKAAADDSDGGNMLMWILIAAGSVVIIVIIVVLVTKKK